VLPIELFIGIQSFKRSIPHLTPEKASYSEVLLNTLDGTCMRPKEKEQIPGLLSIRVLRITRTTRRMLQR
jgi:hypothetical protein